MSWRDRVIRSSNLRDWLKAFGIALLVLLFVKAFIGRTLVIRSTSMYPSFVPGQLVFVNKLAHGARIPWTRTRLPGLAPIVPGDVVAFRFPMEGQKELLDRSIYVKRCVARPGDEFRIAQGEVVVNGDTLQLEDICFNFHVLYTDTNKIDSIFRSWKIPKEVIIEGRGDLYVPLTWQQAFELEDLIGQANVSSTVETVPGNRAYIFPFSKSFRWNDDNYGPLIIPKKGWTVDLNMANWPLYDRIISVYEGNEVSIGKDQKISINGDTSGQYTFKNDYYFVLGDNRHNSFDSRFWGFVPESHLIGIVIDP